LSLVGVAPERPSRARVPRTHHQLADKKRGKKTLIERHIAKQENLD